MLGLLPLLPQAPGTGRKGQMQPEDAMTSLVRRGACGGRVNMRGVVLSLSKGPGQLGEGRSSQVVFHVY